MKTEDGLSRDQLLESLYTPIFEFFYRHLISPEVTSRIEVWDSLPWKPSLVGKLTWQYWEIN